MPMSLSEFDSDVHISELLYKLFDKLKQYIYESNFLRDDFLISDSYGNTSSWTWNYSTSNKFNYCPNCGRKTMSDENYCPMCGRYLFEIVYTYPVYPYTVYPQQPYTDPTWISISDARTKNYEVST